MGHLFSRRRETGRLEVCNGVYLRKGSCFRKKSGRGRRILRTGRKGRRGAPKFTCRPLAETVSHPAVGFPADGAPQKRVRPPGPIFCYTLKTTSTKNSISLLENRAGPPYFSATAAMEGSPIPHRQPRPVLHHAAGPFQPDHAGGVVVHNGYAHGALPLSMNPFIPHAAPAVITIRDGKTQFRTLCLKRGLTSGILHSTLICESRCFFMRANGNRNGGAPVPSCLWAGRGRLPAAV